MRADDAYAAIRDRVVAGDVVAGERLTELGLAGDLGVSRTPVREALRRLEADGLVVADGRGVVVAELDREALTHAYQMRAALEELCARLAARRSRDGEIAPAALRRLRELAAESASAVSERRVRDALVLNRAFHRQMAELGGNPLALDALDRLWDRILVSTRASLELGRDHERVIVEQSRLVDAIEAGDEETAARLARAHVLDSLAEAREREAQVPDAPRERDTAR